MRRSTYTRLACVCWSWRHWSTHTSERTGQQTRQGCEQLSASQRSAMYRQCGQRGQPGWPVQRRQCRGIGLVKAWQHSVSWVSVRTCQTDPCVCACVCVCVCVYRECRNAAQIFKKVTAGIAPEGLARIQDRELKDFVLLCIQHDPNKRPEARQLLKHKFFEPCRAEGLLRKSLAPLATNSLGVSGGPNVPMTPTLPSIASMPHLPNMASGAGGPPLAPRPGSAAGGGAQDSGALARSNSGVWPPTAAAAAAVRAAAGERVSVDSAATADSADSMAMRIAAAAGSTGGGLVATNSVGVVSRPSLPPGYEAASGSNGGVQPVSRRPSAPANLEPITVSVHPTESGELGDDTMIYTPTVRDETTQVCC